MKRHALLLGGFLAGATVLAIALVVWLGGGELFHKYQRSVIYFQGGVAGLAKGAPVTFRGVPIGQVESIGLELDKSNLSTRIPVNVRLSRDVVTLRDGNDPSAAPPDMATLIRRGLRAKLVSLSLLTGQKSIELTMVANAPPVSVGAGPVLEIPVIGDRFDSLIDQVADIPLRETVADLRATMASMRVALASANAVLLSAHTTLDQTGHDVATLAAQARATLVNASDAATKVQESAVVTMASVSRLADNANGTLETLRPEMLKTLANATAATDSARVALDRVAELSAPGAPLRADLESSASDLAQASRSLREWSELLEEHPNAIVFGRKSP